MVANDPANSLGVAPIWVTKLSTGVFGRARHANARERSLPEIKTIENR